MLIIIAFFNKDLFVGRYFVLGVEILLADLRDWIVNAFSVHFVSFELDEFYVVLVVCFLEEVAVPVLFG